MPSDKYLLTLAQVNSLLDLTPDRRPYIIAALSRRNRAMELLGTTDQTNPRIDDIVQALSNEEALNDEPF